MKKSILTIFSLLIFALTINGQAPEAFKYQTVVRDATGQILANQTVTLRMDLIQTATVYTEDHSAMTNDFGLVNLEIGRGTVVIGDFSMIDWSQSTSIQISLDPMGGTNFQNMGTTELLSVPYALHAANAGGDFPTDAEAGEMVYYDGTEWKRTSNIHVNNDGLIGLGTDNPAVELHISDGNTPTLRLEQNTNNGWTAQVWDVAGNEANFFIRDVTGGSLLPFRIKPGAPNNTIYLDADGDVGLGTSSPGYRLSVYHGDKGVQINHTGNSAYWELYHDSGNNQLQLKNAGGTSLGHFDYSSGAYMATSDRHLKSNIQPIATVLSGVMQLLPVNYHYGSDILQKSHLGFIAQDVEQIFPELVSTPTKDQDFYRMNYAGFGVLAIKAIQEQQAIINSQQAIIEQQQSKLDAIEKALAKAGITLED